MSTVWAAAAGAETNLPATPYVVLHEQMQAVKEARYNGIFSIEHSGPDPYAAIQTVIDALVKEI